MSPFDYLLRDADDSMSTPDDLLYKVDDSMSPSNYLLRDANDSMSAPDDSLHDADD